MWLRAAILAMLIGVASCATHTGPVADPHRYLELVPGTSTQAEAITMLGPPNSTASIRDQTLLQWIDVYSAHPIHLAILFGPDGRMVKVTEVFTQ
jgi:hypothetical protein